MAHDVNPPGAQDVLTPEEMYSAHYQARLDKELAKFWERHKWPFRVLWGVITVFALLLASLLGIDIFKFHRLTENLTHRIDNLDARLNEAGKLATEATHAVQAARDAHETGRMALEDWRRNAAAQAEQMSAHVGTMQREREALEEQSTRALRDFARVQNEVARKITEIGALRDDVAQMQHAAGLLKTELHDNIEAWSLLRDEIVRVSSSVSTSVLRGHARLLDNPEGTKEYRPVVLQLPFQPETFLRVTFNGFHQERLPDGRHQIMALLNYDVITDPRQPREAAATHPITLIQNGDSAPIEGTQHQIQLDFAYTPPNHLLFYFPDFVTISVSVRPDRLAEVVAAYQRRARSSRSDP